MMCIASELIGDMCETEERNGTCTDERNVGACGAGDGRVTALRRSRCGSGSGCASCDQPVPCVGVRNLEIEIRKIRDTVRFLYLLRAVLEPKSGTGQRCAELDGALACKRVYVVCED